MFDWDEGREGR